MDNDVDWEKLIEEAHKLWEASQLRKKQPYTLLLIQVLWPFGPRGLLRRHVIDRVWRLREPTSLHMPKAFEQTVQSAFNLHNSENQGSTDGLFYPFGAHGERKLAVHLNKIEPWLKRKGLKLIQAL
jgi:hypothetical protein